MNQEHLTGFGFSCPDEQSDDVLNADENLHTWDFS